MKVFLSSTAQDLVAHRQVADDTILRLSQQVVAMERWGPLPCEPVAECERKARESDLVVDRPWFLVLGSWCLCLVLLGPSLVLWSSVTAPSL